ncbi:MAG: hypothetical protein JST44_02545 [Cyanobacteria bacterium SZAS LIN-5]|nr:hypothetical protein [Cyanobacteria bacterium SZAS LIN-5]
MTSRCPAVLRKLRARALRVASLIAGCLASLLTINKVDAQYITDSQESARVLKLSEQSFLKQEMTMIGGRSGLRTPPKQTRESKRCKDPDYRIKQGKTAFKHYELANHFRSRNKLGKSIEQYKKAIAICEELQLGNPKFAMEEELREVERQRYHL